MTDLLFQGSTRQAVLDDLALALTGETVPAPVSIDGGAGNIQHILGRGWRILIVWDDNYQSGLRDGTDIKAETQIARGLHVNMRVGGSRAEEIQTLITKRFARMTKATRNWGDDRVFQTRDKLVAGQVRKTAKGTCWLQDTDSGGDGFIAHRSAVFA